MSADIINIDAQRDALMQERWDHFVSLDRKARETGKFEHGVAAGKAHRAFLDLFESPEQRRVTQLFREFGGR